MADGGAAPGGDGPRRYSFDELRAATGGFARDRLLGEGGFGEVFRGVLAGRPVAVKRLTQEPGYSPRSRQRLRTNGQDGQNGCRVLKLESCPSNLR